MLKLVDMFTSKMSVFSQVTLNELKASSHIPVINASSNRHPFVLIYVFIRDGGFKCIPSIFSYLFAAFDTYL